MFGNFCSDSDPHTNIISWYSRNQGGIIYRWHTSKAQCICLRVERRGLAWRRKERSKSGPGIFITFLMCQSETSVFYRTFSKSFSSYHQSQKMILAKWYYHMGQNIQEWTKETFLKAVFHKFYLVHSWIICLICNGMLLAKVTSIFKN